MKTRNWIAIGIVLFFIIICLGSTIALVAFDKTYILAATFAILFFMFSVFFQISRKYISFPIAQRRAPIYSFVFLSIGLLFLASSIFDYGYSAFAQAPSIQEKLSIFLRHVISEGFMEIGMGILSLGLGFEIIKPYRLPEAGTQNQKYKIAGIITIGCGIVMFTLGIHMVIKGLYP